MSRWVSTDKPNWSEAIGALFVGVGVLVSVFVAACVGALVWIARDQEQKTLRSYVVMKEPASVENFAVGGVAHVFATLENVGLTPVYDARWQSALNLAPYPSDIPLDAKSCDEIVRSPEQGTPALFATLQSFDKVRKDNASFTQPEIDEVKAGRSAIYFVGRVCYSDIFKRAHYTDFCLHWRWIKDGLVAEFCAHDNESDRE
jgi:hypothetical protein